MRTIQSFAQKAFSGVVALAVMGLALQSMAQSAPTQLSAKVIRVKGGARYSTDGKTWQPVHRGDVLKAGTVIQTAEKGIVDLQLGERETKPFRPVINNATMYQPEEQTANVIRVFENSMLAIDKLTTQDTGNDTVEETQLDLRAGSVMGNVKKLSSASKYEVKIPNGVAGIRGTIYMISSSGVVDVLEGSVVIAVVGSDGTVVTKVVAAGFKYDPMTGGLTQIPSNVLGELKKIYLQLIGPVPTPPTVFTQPGTIIYVTPLDEQGSPTVPPPPPGP